MGKHKSPEYYKNYYKKHKPYRKKMYKEWRDKFMPSLRTILWDILMWGW